jgi:tetratricopeptide (TPR) repeat protein
MESSHSLLGRALRAWRRGDDLAAVRLLRRAVLLRPEEPTWWAALGDLELGLDLYESAVHSYRRALELPSRTDRDRAPILEGLIHALLATERIDEAEGACREVLAIEPTPGRYVQLGSVHEARGRLRDGEAAFELALGLDPRHVEALYRLGTSIMWTRPRPAERLLRRAIRHDPDHAGAICALGLLADRRHGWKEAERLLARAAELGGLEGRPLVYLGHSYEHRGRMDEAEAAYRRAHAQFPADTHPLFALGDLYRGQGRLDEARRTLEHALVMDPRSIDVHLRLGLVLKDLGEATRARSHLAECLRLCPQHPRREELVDALDELADAPGGAD